MTRQGTLAPPYSGLPDPRTFTVRAVEDAGPYEILSVNGAKSSAVRRDAGRRSFCDCQNHSSYISPRKA